MTGNSPFVKVELLHIFNGGHKHAIQWSIDPAFRAEGPFLFLVEVSETPDFSQLVYTIPAGNSYFTFDTNTVLQTNTPSWYYRVKMTTGAGATYYSPSVYHFSTTTDARRYWYARDIVRREFLRYNYTGYPGFILKRKNYGETSRCYVDPVSGVPIADVADDNSTGFTGGGYHKPLKIRFSKESNTNKTSLSEDGSGVQTSESMKVRMVGFPIVAPKDVLVTSTNARYVVGDDVSYTYFPGTYIIIVQMFTAKLLPYSDLSYNVAINE